MRKIKKGDNVVVIAGRDKGKRGDVSRVVDDAHVVVERRQPGASKHTKPNPMKNQPGGIVTKEMPIHVSNVAIWNPVTQQGRPRSASACSTTAARSVSSSPTASRSMAEDKRPGAKSPKAEKKAAKAEKAAQPAAAHVADQPHQPARLKDVYRDRSCRR